MRCKIVQEMLYEMDLLPEEISRLPEGVRAHMLTCSSCEKFFLEMIHTQRAIHSLTTIGLPGGITDHYLSDLHRKLNQVEQPPSRITESQKSRWSRGKTIYPALAAVGVVIIIFLTWWLGIRPGMIGKKDTMATDTLDFYLESYLEESAQNPIAAVKGLEYEWTYFASNNLKK